MTDTSGNWSNSFLDSSSIIEFMSCDTAYLLSYIVKNEKESFCILEVAVIGLNKKSLTRFR